MCRGSVAKSTHAGIPWLRFIRQRLGARIHFWPFDGWDIPAGRSAFAEVYPAVWNRSFANEDLTGDQHDAFTIAGWLSRADRDGSLAAFLKPDLTPAAMNAFAFASHADGLMVFPAIGLGLAVPALVYALTKTGAIMIFARGSQ
jgi:hypothetical protein